ncbi:MAG: PQQ-binding-like beta-propeller repeat protein [Bacteroidetes bacterium]|nr:PQQ-binding-like beta-propeller repeat protein [Bacteroidota bacterium]
MKIKLKYLWVTLLILGNSIAGFSQTTNPDGWYQFRGQNRDGISTESLSDINWSETKPELVWKKELGSAFSELTISNGIIYTMTSEMTDSLSGFEFVAAYDENTGNELWRTKVDSIYIDYDGWGNGTRSTTIIDDDQIYSLSGHGKLSANLKKGGKLLWQIDFLNKFGSTTPRWGFASSPTIVDDVLIMEVGGTDSRAFMGFNKKDGSINWSSENGNASHDSPLAATIDGKEQIIFANGRKLFSFTSTGDTLWTYNMPFGSLTAIPILIDKNKIFLSGVRTPGFIIIEINGNTATEVLNGNSMKNDFSSCVYHNGYIYGYHVAALRCVSVETGEVSWTKRGFGKGSLIMVDDKLLVLSDKGKLAVVQATPEAYIELTTVQAIEGKSWTAPSFMNGKVFVRNLTEMACYKLK